MFPNLNQQLATTSVAKIAPDRQDAHPTTVNFSGGVGNLKTRTNVLIDLGASDFEIKELLAYNQNMFDRNNFKLPQTFPPTPESHVAIWEQYAAEAEIIGIYTVLKQRLVQFQFPILTGISETEEYRTATRKGKSVDGMANATGLILIEPEKLQIRIHQSLAGAIPALIAGNRNDFVTLVQALTKRNEPQPIPNSMGACIVSGYNNWNRIHQYQQQWITQQSKYSDNDWAVEFKRLISCHELYQDKFIILSSGSYSNVAASELGLANDEWEQLSFKIRLEHECTHYFTRRFFGLMRNNLFDELIADYRGIVAALGCYRADWFLRFLGLESFPIYREGGRLQNYKGEPSLSKGAFRILQSLVKKSADNIENFDKKYSGQLRDLAGQVSVLVALTTLTLEELASESGNALLEVAYLSQRQLLFSD
ncbi:hypothetical protein ACE1CI_05915 [Aerosakkonemataceae cyanobacterium BLCC-F50]|uniref:Ppx/GppA phosphatase domain-containing protein n=1 Tax=Floridaenema flaviceps BLCC-F50 TaxID=3153642 RepID=A0ABV4XL86_9CYAN